jgi:dihydroorotase
MSAAPCRVLGLPTPGLAVGAPADLCVVDLDEVWTVTTADLMGKSRNCAFLGEKLTGRVQMTIVDGARRYARAR